MVDPIFPPANFGIWPLTRTGAIVFDAIILIVGLLLWIIPRRVCRTNRIDATNGVVSQCKLWGFWVCGIDSVHIADGQVTINRHRGYCCCSITDMTFPVSSLVKIELQRRSILSPGILWAILVGLLAGFWLHFIPCIWWSCDLHYYDGQTVRGAIWVVTSVIVFIALVPLYFVLELELSVRQAESGPDALDKYRLAVGQGSCWRRSNPSVVSDLNTLSKLAGISQSEQLP